MADDPKCCCDPKVHPDHLVSESVYLEAGKRYQIVPHTCHLLNAEATVYISAGTDATYVKLFTSDDPDDETLDDTYWTLTLGKEAGSSAWTPTSMEGTTFHRGVFASVVSSDTTARVVVNVVAVLREHYTPAFPDPTGHLNNAWKCWRGDDPLYDNFDTGGNYSWANDGATGSASGDLDQEPIGDN